MSPADLAVHRVLGYRCAVCGTTVDVATPMPWRCPRATTDDRRHLLRLVEAPGPATSTAPTERSFADHDHDLAWAAYAAANGMTDTARTALVEELDGAVARVAGSGFVVTPFERSEVLSDELDFDAGGGVLVKDETGGVAGSHKARHLFSILLHLRAAELLGHFDGRPRLAISSCGNAALAAATLASAADWPIDVYVPTWMSDGFGRRLDELGATVHRCERRDDDPPGDPAMLRFREAVDAGSVPFTVQGPENALCLDGGRTIGWEMCAQVDGRPPDHVFVQVGGGAFATCVAAGLSACGGAALHAVQTLGCAPLARAWDRLGDRTDLGGAWPEVMTPWDDPHSAADGILDDETYDWIGVVEAMRSTGGSPVVVAESTVHDAHAMAHRAGFDASPTGSAGLAGLIEARERVSSGARVAVVMSGVTR